MRGLGLDEKGEERRKMDGRGKGGGFGNGGIGGLGERRGGQCDGMGWMRGCVFKINAINGLCIVARTADVPSEKASIPSFAKKKNIGVLKRMT